jgi:hypothetical protein
MFEVNQEPPVVIDMEREGIAQAFCRRGIRRRIHERRAFLVFTINLRRKY